MLFYINSFSYNTFARVKGGGGGICYVSTPAQTKILNELAYFLAPFLEPKPPA